MNSSRHKLLQSHEANEWKQGEVNLIEQEMMSAMQQLVDDEMQKLKDKQEWEEELERRAQSPDFCNHENIKLWDEYEVAFWISTIGCDYSMHRFFYSQIDGSMLLFDMTPETLANDLGIKPLHVRKVLRAIAELRKVMFILSIRLLKDLRRVF